MTSEASCGSRAATHLEMSLQPPPLSKFKSACIKTDRCIMSCCGATAKGSNTVSSCQEAMSLVIKQVVLWGPEDSDQMLPCICRNARWALVSVPYRATVRSLRAVRTLLGSDRTSKTEHHIYVFSLSRTEKNSTIRESYLKSNSCVDLGQDVVFY